MRHPTGAGPNLLFFEVSRVALEDQERFGGGEPTDDRTLLVIRALGSSGREAQA